MQTKSLLHGKEINLTGDNTTIKSSNFNVDKDGNVTIVSEKAETLAENAHFIVKTQNGNSSSNLLPSLLILENNNGLCQLGNFGFSSFTIKNKNSNKGISMIAGSQDILIMLGASDNYTTTISETSIITPTVTQTSLKSKKKNIKKLNINALELVKEADICEYNFKGEKKGDKKHIGLVIGEGYNCPEQVISQDGQGVEQYSLTSLLYKAVQELTAKVEKLEQEVANGRHN